MDRTKYDKTPAKDIAVEPEMIELKRMIRSGELSAGRVADYLKKGSDNEEQAEGRHEAINNPRP